MEYVVAVMGKYLQMLVAYSIFKEEPDQVTEHFEQFNQDFELMCKAFKEVTKQEFKAGQPVELMKPVAPVKPILRETKSELGPELLEQQEKVKLKQFLERNNLQELLTIFMKEGVTLDDLLEITDEEMKVLGIKSFGVRKRLSRVIREQGNNLPIQQAQQIQQVQQIQQAEPVQEVQEAEVVEVGSPAEQETSETKGGHDNCGKGSAYQRKFIVDIACVHARV